MWICVDIFSAWPPLFSFYTRLPTFHVLYMDTNHYITSFTCFFFGKTIIKLVYPGSFWVLELHLIGVWVGVAWTGVPGTAMGAPTDVSSAAPRSWWWAGDIGYSGTPGESGKPGTDLWVYGFRRGSSPVYCAPSCICIVMAEPWWATTMAGLWWNGGDSLFIGFCWTGTSLPGWIALGRACLFWSA
jgi:hypothetical protein